jgi:oligoendopeptidase F
VRTEIAQKLGFENYVAFADVHMNRWDYDRKMIETYRQEILDKVVPITQKLIRNAKLRAKPMNQQPLLLILPLVYPSGNATPKGSAEELVEKAQTMYQELISRNRRILRFHG